MSLLLGLMNRGEYAQPVEDELDQLVASIQTSVNALLDEKVDLDDPRLSTGGDVVGPASATANALALFDGTTGKLIKDSGILASSLPVKAGTLTAGRVVIVGASGVLTDASTFLYDTTLSTLTLGGPGGATMLVVGTLDPTRSTSADGSGRFTFRYDNNGLNVVTVINNRGITAAGHGSAIQFGLASGAGTAVAAGQLLFASEASTFTGATADASFTIRVALDGVLTDRLTITSAGLTTLTGTLALTGAITAPVGSSFGGAGLIAYNGVATAKNYKFAYASTNTGIGNDLGFVIENTDTTADNTTGLHFAAGNPGGAGHYIGASIVTDNGARTSGAYHAADLVFLLSAVPFAAGGAIEMMRLAAVTATTATLSILGNLTVRQVAAGATAVAALTVGNDLSATAAYLKAFSSTFTPSGPIVADGVLLNSERAGGLSLSASHGSGVLRFYSGGTTERARFDTAGTFILNGDLTFTATSTSYVQTNTADAADTKRVIITGNGGGASMDRGAYVSVHGNEFSGALGSLILASGTAGDITLYSRGALALTIGTGQATTFTGAMNGTTALFSPGASADAAGVNVGTSRTTSAGGTLQQGHFLRRADGTDSGSGLFMSSDSTGTATEYWENLILAARGGGARMIFAVDNAAAGTAITERMRIETDGRVGIGGTPSHKFDVFGTTCWVQAAGNIELYASHTTGPTTGGVQALNGTIRIGSITNHPVQFGVANSTYYMQVSAAGIFSWLGALGTHTFDVAATGQQIFQVRNSTSGTGNSASLVAASDIVGQTELTSLSTAWSGVTPGEVAAGSLLRAKGTGGLSIVSTAIAGDIRFYNRSSTLALTLGASQAATFAGSLTVQTAGGNVSWGTYTPTLTNGANVAASTAYQCQYIRVGNTVTVSGRVDIDPTSLGVGTILGISLPVASNFGGVEDCAGVGAPADSLALDQFGIRANVASDRAETEYLPANTSNRGYYFTFTYQVI